MIINQKTELTTENSLINPYIWQLVSDFRNPSSSIAIRAKKEDIENRNSENIRSITSLNA